MLSTTFAYLKVLYTAPPIPCCSSLRHWYEVQQKVKDAEYRLPDRLSDCDCVNCLVFRSKYYPPKDILAERMLYYHHDEQQLSELVGHLNSFKFNLMIDDEPYEVMPYDKREEWFGTEYTTLHMPAKWKELWVESKSKPMDEIFMPEANRFVVQDFKLLWNEQGKPKLPPYPERLVKTNTSELWLCEEYPIFSPWSAAMCDLYVSLLKLHLEKELQLAESASINCDFSVKDNGPYLFVSGLNEKLHVIVEAIAQGMIDVGATFNESILTTYHVHMYVPYTLYVLGQSQFLTINN